MGGYHTPVLFFETIDGLAVKPDGIYIDCTAGGGGHSSAIAERLTGNGRLISIDRDPDAIEQLHKRLGSNEHVAIVQSSFGNIAAVAASQGVDRVDGVLMDLGVSSHQLDCGERGFPTMPMRRSICVCRARALPRPIWSRHSAKGSLPISFSNTVKRNFQIKLPRRYAAKGKSSPSKRLCSLPIS